MSKGLYGTAGKKSFLDCPHNRVQEFTEVCLDCGYNIYTTKEEYLAELEGRLVDDKIRDAEKKLGIRE